VRPEKAYAAEEIGRLIEGATFLILTTFRGLDSVTMNRFRRVVRDRSCRYVVVKNRLFAIAAKQRGLEDLCTLLQGQVGVVFGKDDSLDTLKAVSGFGKENEELRVLGGFFEGKVRTAQETIALATMPPREVIAGGFVGTLQSLLSGVVHILSEPLRSSVFAISAILEKKEDSNSREGD
jgi:large subunit ribosomal protein L10